MLRESTFIVVLTAIRVSSAKISKMVYSLAQIPNFATSSWAAEELQESAPSTLSYLLIRSCNYGSEIVIQRMGQLSSVTAKTDSRFAKMSPGSLQERVIQ